MYIWGVGFVGFSLTICNDMFVNDMKVLQKTILPSMTNFEVRLCKRTTEETFKLKVYA